jgi:dynactin complex subunit
LQTAYDDLTKLSASATNRNEEWYYTVRASDGTSFSDMAVSSTVKILNGKPSISNLVIIPANPNTNDDLMTEYNVV